MKNESELAQLEQFVDTLLTRYNELKKDLSELKATLIKTEEERDDLNRKIAELRNERSEVKNRVSGLIDRIEEWENEQNKPVKTASVEKTGGQGQLFAMEQG